MLVKESGYFEERVAVQSVWVGPGWMASQVQDVEQPHLFPIDTRQIPIDVCVM